MKWGRTLAPAIVAGLLLALVAFVSRGALPGESLYPVREVLGNFGLARSPVEEARALIARARSEVELAEDIEDDDHGLARELARGAIGKLEDASLFLAGVRGEAAEELRDEMEDVQDDAVDVLNDVEASNEADKLRDDDDSSGSGGGDDDNSGSGGGDDSGGHDNSGPGGGDDSDDDNSGSGGGGDSDDNSGSGGGGDNSGSGGDDSD